MVEDVEEVVEGDSFFDFQYDFNAALFGPYLSLADFFKEFFDEVLEAPVFNLYEF